MRLVSGLMVSILTATLVQQKTAVVQVPTLPIRNSKKAGKSIVEFLESVLKATRAEKMVKTSPFRPT